MEGAPEGEAPAAALAAVLKHSSALPPDSAQVRGYDFNRGVDYRAVLEAFGTTGFQATNFGRAVHQINAMIEKKLEPLPQDEDQHEDLTQSRRPLTGCTIFLGYTSNLISSGIRETIRYLVQHNMVDVLVTTAGGVEEDLIKCLAPTYLGEFSLRGKELRENGINRIGNLLVPNDNYCKFEDWLMPILDQMVLEQNTEGVKWTPSKMIARLGKEINNPESVYYWAQKNHIPVLSPALTDGSLGDMIFFHSYKNPGLVLDIVEDLRLINAQAIFAKHSGMIILGGGVVKHHIANANLMRNGADYAVYINTAQEFDGSDSGARPDEAVSWGKIKVDAEPVKIREREGCGCDRKKRPRFPRRKRQLRPRKRGVLRLAMSTNNMSDPRRPNKVLRYKPPPSECNPALDDPTPDYMNLLGMIFSMCGLMLKLKWCAWVAVYCSFISFANSRSSEDTKQMMSSFMLSISAVVMSYLQNPQPMTPPW